MQSKNVCPGLGMQSRHLTYPLCSRSLYTNGKFDGKWKFKGFTYASNLPTQEK